MATKPKQPQESTEQGQGAPSGPAVDPGPPPAFPMPSNWTAGGVVDQLFQTGRQVGKSVQAIREEVQAIATLRQPPAVHSYKAEVLAWLDARDAYDARR